VHRGEVESFINQRREEQVQSKYKYHVPTTTKSLEIIQFVPMEETTQMTQDDIETNEVAVQEEEKGGTIRLGSKLGAAGGSKLKLGFRTPAQGEYMYSRGTFLQ